MKPRDNLRRKCARLHYNKSGKSKILFASVEEAQAYIDKMHLLNYSIYLCKYCGNYHISHKKT